MARILRYILAAVLLSSVAWVTLLEPQIQYVKAFALFAPYWWNISNLPYYNYASPQGAHAFDDAAGWWWNNTAGRVVMYRYPGPIGVYDGFYGGGWDGYSDTNPPYYQAGYITATTGWLNRSYTDSYTDPQRRSVAAHEFGHILGLAHPDPTVALMMMYTCGANSRWCTHGISTPVGDDVNGILTKYP